MQKKLYRNTIITTIMDGIFFILLLILIIYFINLLKNEDIIKSSIEIIRDSNEHSLTGGYETIFGLIGSFFGFIILLLSAGGLFISGSGTILMILLTIHSITIIKQSKNADKILYYKGYKRDSILKLIMHSILAMGALIFTFSNNSFHIVPFLILILLVFIIILCICNLNHLKQINEK